jgi:N-acetylneuraminate lyase
VLRQNKVVGAFIGGSTGEGASLTLEEKISLTKAWAEASAGDPFKVILFLGGTSIKESIELAREAQKLNIYGVSSTAPYYFKPGQVKTLAKCCLEIASAVPNMPYYYYHIPVLTGVYFSMLDLLEEVEGRAGNFAGIKYTHEDFMDYSSCLSYRGGKYDILWGRDENWLAALAMGAQGAVGSTYNYAPALYHQISISFQNGKLEEARFLQQKAIDMIRLLGKFGGIATGKAYMKWIGMDCGEFRLPVFNMSASDRHTFEEEVRKLNLDQYWATV